MKPQTVALSGSTNHSEGLSENDLPSLTTYAIIAESSPEKEFNVRTKASSGSKSCSAQVTQRRYFAIRMAGHQRTAPRLLALRRSTSNIKAKHVSAAQRHFISTL